MCAVAVRRRGVICPVFQNRHHIFPRGFKFVAAVKQSEFAVNHIQQQALVSFRAAAFQCFAQIGCQRHGFDLISCPRGFHLRIEAHGFIWLQLDNEPVGRGAAAFKNMAVQIFEVQNDFRHFARHAFAGTQVEGNALPAFVFDFGFNGDVGFGKAVLRNVDFFKIAVHASGGGILSAHDVFIDRLDGQRLQ
ncbi:Uncharacterised protein [Neisseria meningitidis]|nr:Uncharacterised protein [Neisseria meningitidis]CWT00560.1 Uncharacterised protein [Neisseria meningitidis]CWU23360.1 Uncharacterised protein [Neisseria meningitidis]